MVVAADGDITEDEKPLLGVVDDVDCLLETVRDDVVLLFVVTVIVVDIDDSDTIAAVVTGITVVLFELTLCDFVGGLRGEGGTCRA